MRALTVTLICLSLINCTKEQNSYQEDAANYIQAMDQLALQTARYPKLQQLAEQHFTSDQQASQYILANSSQQFLNQLSDAMHKAQLLKLRYPDRSLTELRQAYSREKERTLMLTCRTQWDAARADCNWDYAVEALGCVLLGGTTGIGGIICGGVATANFLRCGHNAYVAYVECEKVN
jgi:hypothetical protein